MGGEAVKRSAEDACIEYAIALATVREHSLVIRSFPCKEASNHHFDETGERECLSEYWHGITGPDGFVARPQIKFDDMCENCKKREQAYHDRKEARKRLGAAKRSIAAIGKRLNSER
jgi:hypothetical protein